MRRFKYIFNLYKLKETMANETITDYIPAGINSISYLSQTLTEKITTFLIAQGWTTITPRWASLLLFFISSFILYLAIKISQPLIKWLLIGLSIILIVGLIIPWWSKDNETLHHDPVCMSFISRNSFCCRYLQSLFIIKNISKGSSC